MRIEIWYKEEVGDGRKKSVIDLLSSKKYEVKDVQIRDIYLIEGVKGLSEQQFLELIWDPISQNSLIIQNLSQIDIEKKDFDHTDPVTNYFDDVKKRTGEIPTTAPVADTPITGELKKVEDPVTNYFDDVKKRIGEIPNKVVEEVVDTPRKMVMKSLLGPDAPEIPEYDEQYVPPFPRINFSNTPFAHLGTANQTTYDPYEFMYSAYDLNNKHVVDHFDGIDYGIPSFRNFKSEELNAVLQQQSRNQGF